MNSWFQLMSDSKESLDECSSILKNHIKGSDVINIIKNYLKPFPFKKEIESLHSESLHSESLHSESYSKSFKVKYRVSQFFESGIWRSDLHFYTSKGTIISFTECVIDSTKRVVFCYLPNVIQYAYCQSCSIKLKEELWHYLDTKGCQSE